jgi:4-diphosphocytidyl-2-C-methyl-D-erythritol kinase
VTLTLEKQSPCKVNLLLNILGRRPDGFHELETVMQPLPIFDRLSFMRGGQTIQLSCSEPSLPTDSRNLVCRAAERFLETARIKEGVRIELEKKIPLAAGLGGGSGNAATTLLALDELFDHPLTRGQMHELAASLGSDVPFFLQSQPALATGRGELLEPLEPFLALRGAVFLLIHPGFGISTPWAYQQLARFPSALKGTRGRARALVGLLQTSGLAQAGARFYNSLEAPALEKFPILALFQEFFREHGAAATLMSGSGSTTFAVVTGPDAAQTLAEKFKSKFGAENWMAVARI